MDIILANRRGKSEDLRTKYVEDIVIIDVTSKGDEPWGRFSPFWTHGDIPVPFSDDIFGTSVKGIWQALKVFESEDVELSKLQITNMKGLKKTVRQLVVHYEYYAHL